MATPIAMIASAGALPMALPVEDHGSGIGQHTGDGAHERRLARAVGADNGDRLAFAKVDIDAEIAPGNRRSGP
jgi:hypothetical protein